MVPPCTAVSFVTHYFRFTISPTARSLTVRTEPIFHDNGYLSYCPLLVKGQLLEYHVVASHRMCLLGSVLTVNKHRTHLFSKLGGPTQTISALESAFQDGNAVTAKVLWLPKSSNAGERGHGSAEAKPQWIRCTPVSLVFVTSF
jgi:hypothetical protein